MNLADFLKRELEAAGSMSALTTKTGVAHTAIQAIIDGTTNAPKLETLVKFSQTFHIPLWRIVEMAGFDLGFAQTSTSIAERIASLIESVPELSLGLDRLLTASPEDVMGMLAYLEGQAIVHRLREERVNQHTVPEK